MTSRRHVPINHCVWYVTRFGYYNYSLFLSPLRHRVPISKRCVIKTISDRRFVEIDGRRCFHAIPDFRLLLDSYRRDCADTGTDLKNNIYIYILGPGTCSGENTANFCRSSIGSRKNNKIINYIAYFVCLKTLKNCIL